MQSVFSESLRRDVNYLRAWKQHWDYPQLRVLGDVYHDFNLNICPKLCFNKYRSL